jgi:hypothetical protein
MQILSIKSPGSFAKYRENGDSHLNSICVGETIMKVAQTAESLVAGFYFNV